MTDTTTPRKSQRGFASMTREANAAISSRGGKAAHAAGTAHEWNRSEAVVAGRKGGLAVSAKSEYMAEIGRRGGLARKRNARQRELDAIDSGAAQP
jgi:general stress protein YciG